MYLDGIWLKRSWGGEVRERRGAGGDRRAAATDTGKSWACAEGTKEDKESWRNFLRHLKERGLKGVRLVISDKCLGLVEALGEFYPEAQWQRCVVHWYRNVFTVVPKGKVKEVAAMLKAIHAQEDRQAARREGRGRGGEAGGDEARRRRRRSCGRAWRRRFSYMAFPREHWRRFARTICWSGSCERSAGGRAWSATFPDGRSALMLVAARLRHIAGTRWGTTTVPGHGSA